MLMYAWDKIDGKWGEKKWKKNEGRYRNVETKNIRSGQAFHYRYIIDLYSIYIIYYKKVYVYIYIYKYEKMESLKYCCFVWAWDPDYFICIINHCIVTWQGKDKWSRTCTSINSLTIYVRQRRNESTVFLDSHFVCTLAWVTTGTRNFTLHKKIWWETGILK